KTMALEAHEFIRRFLQHVLPSGFHKVRYHGLWAPSNRERLRRIQDELATDEPRPAEQETTEPPETAQSVHPLEGKTCPHCGDGRLVWIADVPRPARAPPRLIPAPPPDVVTRLR
ncbi:MAG: transposase, partial [Phycisphaerales bacterium]